MKFYLVIPPLILIKGPLDVIVVLPLFLIIGPSLIQGLKNAFFFGYPVRVKGYRVLDLSTKTVFTSRDVVFHENYFPYVQGNTDFNDPFITSDVGSHSPTDSNLDSFVTPVSISKVPLPSHTSNVIPIPSHTSNIPIALPLSINDNDNSTSIPHDTSLSHPHSLEITSVSPIVPIPVLAPPHTRKSTRVHKTPAYLQEYACNSAAIVADPGCPYDMADFLSYSHLNPSY